MAKQYGGIRMIPKVRKNPGDLLTVGHIADAIMYRGQNRDRVADRVRWYLRQGYLNPAARETEGQKAFLFYPHEVVIAELLTRLTAFGVADKNAAIAVSNALTVWKEGDVPPEGEPPHFSPGMHIIREFEQGAQDWVFDLWMFVNPETGEKNYEARVMAKGRDEGTGLTWIENQQYEAQAVWSVDLIGLLNRIHPSAKARREASN